MHTFGEMLQDRIDAGLQTRCFDLHVQKAWDTVGRSGLWEKWLKVEVWRRMESLTECTRSAAILDEELFKFVNILQGVAQGCTLSPRIIRVSITDLIVNNEAGKQGVTAEKMRTL